MAAANLNQVISQYGMVFRDVGQKERGKLTTIQRAMIKEGKRDAWENFNSLWGAFQTYFVDPYILFTNLMNNGGVKEGDREHVQKIADALSRVSPEFEQIYRGLLRVSSVDDLGKLFRAIIDFQTMNDVISTEILMTVLAKKYEKQSTAPIWKK